MFLNFEIPSEPYQLASMQAGKLKGVLKDLNPWCSHTAYSKTCLILLVLFWENDLRLSEVFITQLGQTNLYLSCLSVSSVTLRSQQSQYEQQTYFSNGSPALCTYPGGKTRSAFPVPRVCSLHTVCQARKTNLSELSFTRTSMPRSKYPWRGRCWGGIFMSY